MPGAVKGMSLGGGGGAGAGIGVGMGYMGMMVFQVLRSIGASASQITSTGSSANV